MTFFHQLKVLLWKNYILKKRSPVGFWFSLECGDLILWFQFVLLFELVIPLVLFLVMTGIRRTQQSSFHSQSKFRINSRGEFGENEFLCLQRIIRKIFLILIIDPNRFHRRVFSRFFNRFALGQDRVMKKVSVFFPMDRKTFVFSLDQRCFSSVLR